MAYPVGLTLVVGTEVGSLTVSSPSPASSGSPAGGSITVPGSSDAGAAAVDGEMGS